MHRGNLDGVQSLRGACGAADCFAGDDARRAGGLLLPYSRDSSQTWGLAHSGVQSDYGATAFRAAAVWSERLPGLDYGLFAPRGRAGLSYFWWTVEAAPGMDAPAAT